MTQGVFRPVLPGVVLVAAIALGGCGTVDADPPETPAPTAAPVRTPEPEPEPEPAPAPPQPTAAMDVPDRAGAEAAAVYFIELVTYAYMSGDLSRWVELSGQTCAFCSSVAEDVRRAYADGNYLSGGELAHLGQATVLEEAPDRAVFTLAIDFAWEEATENTPDGRVAEELPYTAARAVLELAPVSPGQWVLTAGALEANED